jgi:glycopeptide antibiotics resistance protein
MYYVSKLLPFMAAAIPVYILLRFLFIKRRNIITINYRHEAALFIFIIFIIGLASITVFPKSSATLSNGKHVTNLIPFKVFKETYINTFKYHIMSSLTVFIGNIVMFMPFGFFPALLWKGFSLKKTFLLGCASSLFIELCQLLLPRNTDVDDLWLNTLGAVLGYSLYKLLEKRFKNKLDLYK